MAVALLNKNNPYILERIFNGLEIEFNTKTLKNRIVVEVDKKAIINSLHGLYDGNFDEITVCLPESFTVKATTKKVTKKEFTGWQETNEKN